MRWNDAKDGLGIERHESSLGSRNKQLQAAPYSNPSAVGYGRNSAAPAQGK